MQKIKALAALLLGFSVAIAASFALAGETVRVGVLKFGTVNWEIDTIRHFKLDKKNGIELDVVPLAGNEATRIALLSGAVDIIVSDWLFVSRQRAEGAPLAFVPYSTSVGAIMVPPGSDITTLADLKGKTIGVAGGPLDKSWLMLRGLANGKAGFDLAAETTQAYGAPPLLAEKLRQGELDAAINYWHYNARLEAEGYRTLASAQEAAAALGATGDISAIGYVFNETWANDHIETVLGFVQASRDAKALLAISDEAWERLKPLMKASDAAVFDTLVKRYRQGIPARPIAEEAADTARIYDYLARVGGEKLVGKAKAMAPGTFWSVLTNGT
ncbi:MAG TPA: ABC transporter substrate-binding protein [Afifellaceae bacterium]|nr:ABC transporter substrate-binding protein [Afifellaceae bacterium]